MPEDGDNGNGKQLHQLIGGMRSDIKHVVESQKEVKGAVKELTEEVAKTAATAVSEKDCAHRTSELLRTVGDLKEGLAKKQTRQDHPAVGDITGQIPVYNPEGHTRDLFPPKNGLVERMKANIGLATAAIGLISLLGAGVVKAAYVIVNLDTALARSERRQEERSKSLKKELKAVRAAANEPKIIYTPVPESSDAGPSVRYSHRRYRAY